MSTPKPGFLSQLGSSITSRTQTLKAGFKKATTAMNPRTALTQAQAAAKKQAEMTALKQAGLSTEQATVVREFTAESGGTLTTMQKLSNFFKVTLPAAIIMYRTPILIAIAVVIVAVVGVLYIRKRSKDAEKDMAVTNAEKKANELSAKTAKAEGFQDSPAGGVGAPAPPAADAPAAELPLINLQPLAIKQAGFLGPLPNGSFDAQQATSQALRAGFRTLVLQIDYLDIKKEKFEEPGYPTLLYRDNTGALVSTNSGSLEDVVAAVAGGAFRPEVPNSLTPIILYLHIVRSPSPVRQQREYIRFLSRIARALAPLAPMHLGLTPLGNFHRQNLEGQLLMTPLKQLEGQVVILCNADTSVFRTPPSENERYSPSDDLDFWVNLRVSLDSEDDPQGLATVSEKASAVVVSLEKVLAMTQAKRDAFAAKGKTRFVIAMPGQMKNPDPKDLDVALNELGINAVPLDAFSDSVDATKKLLDEYQNKTWRQKPLALRNVGAK